jgi:serralysin
MAITITASDANKDGKGINVAAFLTNYDKTFTRAGYGSFNSKDPMAMSGTQYSVSDAKTFGMVASSGKTPWKYDMVTHKITGSLNTVDFGTSVALNDKTSKFGLKSDLKISGLGVTDAELAGEILGDLMAGKLTVDGATSSLLKVLKSNALVFNGSTGSDSFTGFGKADKLSGGSGSDTLKGGAGNDTLSGGVGNDKLSGDAGNDKLSGGSGNDTLDGGAGNDRLTGGSGNDVFIFKKAQGNDTITDFSAGSAKGDVIRLDKSLLSSFKDVLAHADDSSSGVVIDYGNNTIKLAGVDKADLHANDFFFF